MLVFERKFRSLLNSEPSTHIFEENELIKKFLISIEAELFSAASQNAPPDFHDLSSNPETLENFCHGYFIRENYIKMLISITANLIEKFNGSLISSEDDKTETETLFQKAKDEYTIIKTNLAEFKEAFARVEEKNRHFIEEIAVLEGENEKVKEELLLTQEKLMSLGEIQQKFNEALELRDLEDPKDKIIEEMKQEKAQLKASNKQLKTDKTVLESELQVIQEKYFKTLESQQQVVTSSQNLINKKLTTDYQKLLEENNKLMAKTEELLTQISEVREDQSVRLSEDEEETEATNTIKEKNPAKVAFGRTGSLFEEFVSLRNIEFPDVHEDFPEDLPTTMTAKKIFAPLKNRNLSLDYNPSFVGFADEGLRRSPKVHVSDEKNYEEKKRRANNAYEDFFLLTCQSVKLNFKHMDDILDVDIRPFYKEVVESRIPFHKWYEWIEKKLEKIYEQKMGNSEKGKSDKAKKKKFFFF